LTTTASLVTIPAAVAAASEIAATLASPGTVLPDGYRGDGRRWPQSLAGGAAGIALLHVERARSGHGNWATARAWLAEAASGSITAASNARLFFGVPALAFLFHIAAESTGHYRGTLAALDDAAGSVTRAALDAADARVGRRERPELREFDLIRGLAGLGAYHLAAHPGHKITYDVLACLGRLTEPLPGLGDGLPPWWTGASPSGEPSPDFPGGHGNVGMSHGISAVLAVLSMAILRGITVPGAQEAAYRICAWTDQWRHGDQAAPWWPGIIAVSQAEAGCVDPALRPRPSWCYGVAGTARAQQLAGLALGDPNRRAAAEAAILAVLRDPAELGRLTEPGLCHGTAGLLQASWRMAADATSREIEAELPRLAAHLAAQLAECEDDNPELLDGTAGTALALHTAGTGNAPEPSWDAFLALA
jgi:lantibiotic biosynthesis protein